MDTVRVLSTLAVKGAFRELATQFEAASGLRVDADFAPTVALLERLRGGEAADVVILTREGLDEMAGERRVAAASCVDLARSYVGIAVKAGRAHPDISSEAALRTTLLRARAVAYSRIGASGILFAELIVRLGIAHDINAHAVIIPSGLTAERVVADEADLAIQQVSELIHVPGITFVGTIPSDLQPVIFFAGALTSTARQPEAASALIRFLASPEAAPVILKAGLTPLAGR